MRKQGPENMHDRLQHLLEVVSSERFLKKKGLGNEVPFFICPYDPKDGVEMERMQRQLVNKLENAGVQVLFINLYDLTIEMLKERNLWERLLAREESTPKSELLGTLQGVLDSGTHLVPAMVKKMEAAAFDVLIISGVGEVFPYIRSHNVLNNLQKAAKEKPTLMFFPGTYTHSIEMGASLDLFGRLRDDKYYRAFNIDHYQI